MRRRPDRPQAAGLATLVDWPIDQDQCGTIAYRHGGKTPTDCRI